MIHQKVWQAAACILGMESLDNRDASLSEKQPKGLCQCPLLQRIKNRKRRNCANELKVPIMKAMEEEFLKGYIDGLKEMVSITNHKVRQPVANIIGMACLLEGDVHSLETLQKIAGYMKQSAVDLDTFTRELTDFICNLEQRERIKRKKRKA